MMHIFWHRRPAISRFVRFPLMIVPLGLIALSIFLFLQEGRRIAYAGRTEQDGFTRVPQATGLIISEFRLRGPGGASDEFVEIYNNTGTSHTVTSVSGTGYAIAASDGVVRCTIPNSTLIPAGGHYLCANSVGYSLFGYPAGIGSGTNPNATYTTDIPDNAGVALFNNNTVGGSFTLANRFDAVGSTTEGNPIYKEGTGYPALSAVDINFCFFRIHGPSGLPTDTDNNANDLLFVDPLGIELGAGQRLGAPGPQNLSSPAFSTGTFAVLPLDNTRAVSSPPNRVLDFTSDPPNNSTFGTVSIRRRFVNQTGGAITRLRFRIIDISNFSNTAPAADLRARTSFTIPGIFVNDAATCAATGSPATPPCTVTVQGTTLETPPAQVNGGGMNSSLSAGTVTMGAPLANGASINLQFLFGLQRSGNFRLAIELEATPGGAAVFYVRGSNGGTGSDGTRSIADYDGDGKSDISVFRPSAGVWHLQQSQAGYLPVTFGLSTDRIAPEDYDGDLKVDIAVYRPSTGFWYILKSSDNTFSLTQFGIAEDLPTPGDYDGDYKADLSLFRPSNGTWYRLNSTDGAFAQVAFGTSGDKPTVGDFDGDAKHDLAVYRPSAGAWYRLNSSSGAFVAVSFGLSTDIAVPGDFDGDDKSDVSVFRPSNGTWYRLNSDSGAFVSVPFGINGDVPAPGLFDLDFKEDISVFRPSNGTWYRLNSSSGAFVTQPFGSNGDRPTLSAFQY